MLYLAIGRRELGKTTLVTSLARKVAQRIILDPRRMIRNTTARTVSEPADVQPAILELWNSPETQHELVITPRGAPQRCFVELCAGVQAWIERDESAPLAVILDEMRFVETGGVESFDFMLRCAPRDVVHVFMTCHRPKDVPVDVRAIMDHWLLFQCSQRHDLKEIGEMAGPDVVSEVQRLKPFEWVQWDDSKGAMRLHKTPSAWYVPLREVTAAGAVDTFADMPTSDPMRKGRLFG